MSELAEVRVFTVSDLEKDWREIPVASYMPIMFSGKGMEDNLKKRIDMTYFRTNPNLVKARWNPRTEPEKGIWIERDSLAED